MFVYPLLFITRILYRTGLIWSVGFYLITEFYFYGTIIQDYRMSITILLSLVFFWKTFKLFYGYLSRNKIQRQVRNQVEERKELKTRYEQE